jgi:predicted TIM-barrel fold metal-dependent hydrolase
MKSEVIDRIKKQVKFLEDNKDQLTIDADVHPTNPDLLTGDILTKYQNTPNYYHGRPISGEDLLTEMQMAEVDMALIWQNPAATPYTSDQDENLNRLLKANEYIFNLAQSHPDKFIPAGWTDPKALGLENAIKIIDIFMKDFGFVVVKMNPAQNAYPIDSEEAIALVEKIASQKGIVAFHYGADTPYTPASGLEKIATSFPDTRIIGIHMGGGGASYNEGEELYNQTRELGLRYPNLFFVQSAKRDTHIESDFITYTLAGAPFSRNIACASDAPYGRQTWNFGGYRAMFKSLINSSRHTDARVRNNPEVFNAEIRQNYMGRNLADLIITGYKMKFPEFFTN